MNTDEILTEAERALRGGQIVPAETIITRAWPDLSKAPSDALHLLGDIRVQTGKSAEAEQFYRAAVRAQPKALRHHIALGHALVAAGNAAGAADAYAEALKIDPKWPGLGYVFARAAYECGRASDAERVARQLVKDAPSADAWDVLSCALRAQNKGPEALKAAEEALKLDPANTPAKHSQGAALLMSGREQAALDVFDALTAQGVVAPVLWLNRGAALERLGRKAEAEAVYADAAARWPTYPNLQAQLAARRR